MNADARTQLKWAKTSMVICSFFQLIMAVLFRDFSNALSALTFLFLALLVFNDRPPGEVYAKKVADLREQGLYPQPGEETDADVRNLYRSKRRIFAIKLYMDIHGVEFKEAKEAVERMVASPQ